ncbi:hypothetical protein AVEN_158627-1 [Araneus ventricosus]|uniref:Uncharacterized protein n=1 Tax=Araneus ventricosus TaxID=182803 RepID=A0A4Y2I6F0_ARAVE|nr:hypothetical protein AVEN_158627-1 [Araneus ventricosus]
MEERINNFFSLATAYLEPTLKDLTWPNPSTEAVEELVPISIMPLNASSKNRGILKDRSRIWKIFGSKGSHPTSSPGIESSILSDSFIPQVSFILQIKIISGGLVNINSAPSSLRHRAHPVHSAFKLQNQRMFAEGFFSHRSVKCFKPLVT